MISIIIPFYNVEKYIEKCILSVKNQTFSDFECILIDDESPDNSFEIAQRIIQGDSRFRIIRQKNKGLGGARNTGIENSKGDFLTFLDSDDYWEPDFLEKMYNKIVNNDADLVECRYRLVNDDDINNSDEDSDEEEAEPNKEITNFEAIQRYLLNSPTTWNKIYRRNTFADVFFPEKRYYEDLATTYKLAPRVRKICFVNKIIHNYFVRSNSIMRTFTEKHYNDLKATFSEINETLGNNFITKEERSIHFIRICFEDEKNHYKNRKMISDDILSYGEILLKISRNILRYGRISSRVKLILMYKILPKDLFRKRYKVI